jgi:hypothetical protein
LTRLSCGDARIGRRAILLANVASEPHGELVSRSVHELVLGPVEIGAKRCRRRQLRPLDVLPKRRYRQLVDTDRAVGCGHRSGAGLEARHGDVERDVELRLAARFDDEA